MPAKAQVLIVNLFLGGDVHRLGVEEPHLAAGQEAIAVLQEHVMWRVAIEVELRLLVQAMDTYDLSDTFPFAIPVLTRLFQARNILAHSLEAPVAEERQEIGYLSVHRGKITEHTMRIDSLDWLLQQGTQAFGGLGLISEST